MGGAVGSVGVLEGVGDRVHQGGSAFGEVGVERWVHAAEERGGNGGAAELAILDIVDPGGHPAAADEGFVRFGLVLGGALHRGVVEPDVGEVKAGEDAIGGGLPSDAELDRLVAEGFFAIGGPGAFGDEFLNAEAFTATPDASGGIEGQFFFGGFGVAAFLWLKGGDDHACVAFDLHFLELPDESFALAVAGFVFEEKHMILGGEDACTAIMIGVFFPAIDRQDRHSGGFRVGRKKGADVHYGAERDVPQIGRCAVITHDTIRQHGEWVRVIAEEHARSLQANAAAAVRMIHEDEFATI